MQTVKENFIISKIYGLYYDIYNPAIGFKRAVLKGNLRLILNEERHPFVIGDRVAAIHTGSTDWLIKERLERINHLARKSETKDMHVLAANMDMLIIISSLANPETKDGFIDRCLAAAYPTNIKPMILFTKKDLVDLDFITKKESKYRNLGYEVASVSFSDPQSIEEVKSCIEGKISFLAGNSGTGKSTFINCILGNELLKTNEISLSTGKGRHTTTNSSLIQVNQNTLLIDSPGVKEWGLAHLTSKEVLESFPELFKHKEDCTSSHCCYAESDCILVQKLNTNTITEDRQKSIQNILESLNAAYKKRGGDYPNRRAKDRIRKN